MIKRYLCFGIYLLGAATISGCMVTQGEIQALRADIAALERDRAQQRRELAGRLERLDSRMSQPESEFRRELAQTTATNQEIRVELQTLRGQMEELQYRTQSGSGASAEMGEILADKVVEIETRLFALEQRVDPQLSARAASSRSPTVPSESSMGSEPAGATMPALARDVPEREAKPPGQTPPPTQPLTSRAEPVTGQSDADAHRLYERAKQEYDAKNYEVAAVLFKQLLREHPESSLAGNSQYWLGETFYAQRQYEAAIVAFDEVIQKYGDNAKVAASILKQGYAFDALDDSRNARFFLEQVQRRFPDSEEAKQAEAKLKTLK
jgi:tol-pal system protein YbgF